VLADDGDAGLFGTILYSIKEKQTDIAIDEFTGDVFLLKKLDYETTNRKQ